jgi:hypothetical protein
VETIDEYAKEKPLAGFANPMLLSSVMEPRKSMASEIMEGAMDGSFRDIFFSRLFFGFLPTLGMEFKTCKWRVLELKAGAGGDMCPYGQCENQSEMEVGADGAITLGGEKTGMPNPFAGIRRPFRAKIRADPLEPSIYRANFISYFNVSLLDICSVVSDGKSLGWAMREAELPENPLFALSAIAGSREIGGLEKDGVLYPNPSLMWNEPFSLNVYENSRGAERMRNAARYETLREAGSFIKHFVSLGGRCGDVNDARRQRHNIISREIILGSEMREKVLHSMKEGFDYREKGGLTFSKVGTLIAALARDADEGRITLRYSELSEKAAGQKNTPREAIADTDLFLLGDIDIGFYRDGNEIIANVSLSRMTTDDCFLNIPYRYRIERIRDRIVLMVE